MSLVIFYPVFNDAQHKKPVIVPARVKAALSEAGFGQAGVVHIMGDRIKRALFILMRLNVDGYGPNPPFI